MQRGRKSAAALGLVCIDTRRKPIDCPAGLLPSVEEIFKQTVASCAPQHFRPSNVPLLVNFSVAAHLTKFYSDLIGESPEAFRHWEAASKLMLSMATKLRLTPSSRLDRKTVGREEEPRGKRPWDLK
jgi:hypothetical protein